MRVYERFRDWSPAEVEFLMRNSQLSHSEVADELGRTAKAVRYARRCYGCNWEGDLGRINKAKQRQRGSEIRDKRGPDVEHCYGAGSPCLRCWNAGGSKDRFGCLKCEERCKFDAETQARGVVLTFDNGDYRHQISHQRTAIKWRSR